VTFRRTLFAYRSAAKDHVIHVREQLNAIDGPLTGKALLKELRDTGHWLRILPNWNWLGPISGALADGSIIGEPGGGGIVTSQAATAKGGPITDEKGWVIRDAAGRPVVGTGGGSNAVVWFSSGRWNPKHPIKSTGYQPDEILYHELVHASRQMRGVMNWMRVNNGYNNLEEYIAIILTNIYLSEKGQTKFVRDHEGGPVLQGAEADNFLHNSQHTDIPPTMVIQNFKDYQPDFYDALVKLSPGRPRYNWVRQYEEEWRALERQNRKPG